MAPYLSPRAVGLPSARADQLATNWGAASLGAEGPIGQVVLGTLSLRHIVRSECNRPLKRARPVAVAAPISYLYRNHGRGDGSG